MRYSRLHLLMLALTIPGPAPGQTPVDHKQMLTRLESHADAFERTAYRIAGIETLTQTVPDGMRTGRDLRGGYTKLPGYSRTLVSEYGFVSLDAPGGAVKEVRRVLTIDGQKWSKQSRSLRSL
ncbi:MAG: hypothetical protein H7Y20_16575, partial [Bryobacteraceae bacterium]|nr:hypothetical protein [Bryobacteraceae bacterium]